jgi:predicted transcriptional regulator
MMRVRKVIIGVRRPQQWAADMKREIRRGTSGQRVRSGESLCFENAAALRNFLSDRRLELLRAIRRHEPRSIKELAARVGRDLKNVNADVHYLARLGLIDLAKEGGAGAKGRKTPRAVCDEIELHIPL